jgi:hypothetical protein
MRKRKNSKGSPSLGNLPLPDDLAEDKKESEALE